jgi:hypothetical protein
VGEVEDLLVQRAPAERLVALPLEALNVPLLTGRPLRLRADALPASPAAGGSGGGAGR